MLAAKTAWAILESEHGHMRRLLAAMGEVLDEGAWRRPGAAQTRLAHLIDALQVFDRTTHRPKGVVMMQAMSGRSTPADLHLEKMQQERERDDAMLSSARQILEAVAGGDDGACGDCFALLMRYREGMLLQMAQEETLLRAHAERLLTAEEWSRVVSDISATLYGGAKATAQAQDGGLGPA
jgi:hemerythrin-like domain-containing protein